MLILTSQLTRKDTEINGITKSNSTEGDKLYLLYGGLYVFKNIFHFSVVGAVLKHQTVQPLRRGKHGGNTLGHISLSFYALSDDEVSFC